MEYELALKNLKNTFADSRVICLEIVRASEPYEQSVKGISKSINEYNGIIHELFTDENIVTNE